VKIFLIVFGIVLVLGAAGVTGYIYLHKFMATRNLSSKVKVKSRDFD
jgi:hypothetical protein